MVPVKSEIRNPKQIQMTEIRRLKTETLIRSLGQHEFGAFDLWILNLFRISIFGFRASTNGPVYLPVVRGSDICRQLTTPLLLVGPREDVRIE